MRLLVTQYEAKMIVDALGTAIAECLVDDEKVANALMIRIDQEIKSEQTTGSV